MNKYLIHPKRKICKNKNSASFHLEISELLGRKQIMSTQKGRSDWWLMREIYEVFSYVGEQRKTEYLNLNAQMADDQWIDSVQERTRNSGSF